MRGGRARGIIAPLAVALAFGIVGTSGLLLTHAGTATQNKEAEDGAITGNAGQQADSTASGGKAVQFGVCTVSSKLVNSCRPWLGAASNGYVTPDFILSTAMANEESRIGRQLDIVHDYRNPGTVMSADDQTLAKRTNTILLMNWKPSLTWADASGCGTSACDTVDGQIDDMANSIKSLGSTKIMVALFHEPENDVTAGGAPNCSGGGSMLKGTSGTTADYVNMWHNVRARFDTDGVTNVVWVMNYMGYYTYDCMIGDLWPGNSYVDWIMWDSYANNSSDFDTMAGRFYNVLLADDDAAHDYDSKAWGLGEWGATKAAAQSTAYALYDNAKTALDSNTFPRLKAYVIWDSDANGAEIRTSYDANGSFDQTEQDHYNAFADDPRFTDAFYQK